LEGKVLAARSRARADIIILVSSQDMATTHKAAQRIYTDGAVAFYGARTDLFVTFFRNFVSCRRKKSNIIAAAVHSISDQL
jgi:hypothetical protein